MVLQKKNAYMVLKQVVENAAKLLETAGMHS